MTRIRFVQHTQSDVDLQPTKHTTLRTAVLPVSCGASADTPSANLWCRSDCGFASVSCGCQKWWGFRTTAYAREYLHQTTNHPLQRPVLTTDQGASVLTFAHDLLLHTMQPREDDGAMTTVHCVQTERNQQLRNAAATSLTGSHTSDKHPYRRGSSHPTPWRWWRSRGNCRRYRHSSLHTRHRVSGRKDEKMGQSRVPFSAANVAKFFQRFISASAPDERECVSERRADAEEIAIGWWESRKRDHHSRNSSFDASGISLRLQCTIHGANFA